MLGGSVPATEVVLPRAAEEVHPLSDHKAHLTPSGPRRCPLRDHPAPGVLLRRIEAVQVVEVLVQIAVVAAENVDQVVVDERRVAPAAHRDRAQRARHVPLVRRQVQVDDLRVVDLLLRVVGAVAVAAPPEDVHSVVEYRRRMEVPVARRGARRADERPVHRLQVEAVHVAGELVDLLLEAAEDVHEAVDDAGGVAVARAGDAPRHLRLGPLQRLRVEAEQDIALGLVVSAAPQVDLVPVRDRRVAVALERHLRVLQRSGGLVPPLRHLEPPQVLCVQDVHVDRDHRAVVLVQAVAPERVNVVVDGDRRVIDPPRPSLQVRQPKHIDLPTEVQMSSAKFIFLFV